MSILFAALVYFLRNYPGLHQTRTHLVVCCVQRSLSHLKWNWNLSVFLQHVVALVIVGSFRFDDGWILRRLNSNFIHVRMRQIFPPSVLPMLQHAKGLTTVVVRTQRLVSYRRRSRPACKSKAPYCSRQENSC